MRFSSPVCRVALCSFLILSTVAGCATYEAKKVSPASATNTLAKEFSASADTVDFRCCSLAEGEMSKNYLGIDPSSTGMIPVLLNVKNKGNSPIKVDVAKCFITVRPKGDTFKAIILNEACDRARRSDAPVIGATIAFGLVGALISGSQTAEANRTLEQDYFDKYFKPTLISSGSEGQGVIFFDAPKEGQILIQSVVMTTVDVNTMEQKETRIEFSR